MPRDKKGKYRELESEFPKTDLERLGFFKEFGYITINDPYVDPNPNRERFKAKKGVAQMLCGGEKIRDGTQAAYFQATFLRPFVGEGYSDQISKIRAYRNKKRLKFLHGPFHPNDGKKDQNGLGSYYDTFGKGYAAMSREILVPKEIDQPEPKPNIYVNPPKKGSGYGYYNITISHYPEWKYNPYSHFHDKYERLQEIENKKNLGGPFISANKADQFFDSNPYKLRELDPKIYKPPKGGPRKAPNPPKYLKHPGPFLPSSPGKLDGGMKAGTISKYPEHAPDPYALAFKYPKDERNKWGKVYLSAVGPHSVLQPSVLNKNAELAMNQSTICHRPEFSKYRCKPPACS